MVPCQLANTGSAVVRTLLCTQSALAMVIPCFAAISNLLLLVHSCGCRRTAVARFAARDARSHPSKNRLVFTVRAASQVHEHCWTVVRWAILAIGSGDSASRMLRFYSRLLEHFMGLDPRTPEEVLTVAARLASVFSWLRKTNALSFRLHECWPGHICRCRVRHLIASVQLVMS